MIRLLWKEWRERGIWLALWVLAGIGVAAFAAGQRCLGSDSGITTWALLPAGLAALAGLDGYSSESRGERASFLHARAISWKQLLSAKVLIGVATALLAAGMGALACWLTLPPAFLPFATAEYFALGALEIAAFTAAVYLLALAISMACTGMAGSILRTVLFLFIMMGASVFPHLLYGQIRGAATALALLLGLPVAGIVVVRFGITLGRDSRYGRFLRVLLVPLVIGLALDFIPKKIVPHPLDSLTERKIYQWSPSGKYAFTRSAWIDRATGTETPVDHPGYTANWLSNDCLYEADYSKSDGPMLFCWQDDGVVQQVKVQPPSPRHGVSRKQPRLSPDGRKLLVDTSGDLQLVDMNTRTVQVLAMVPQAIARAIARAGAGNFDGPFSACWWQSNTAVGYLDPQTGERIIVAVE